MQIRTSEVMRTASLLCLLVVTSSLAKESTFNISDNETIVFLGGTNMVHLQQAGYFESIVAREYSRQRPKFRDLAWEADTVSRLGTVVERWRRDGFGQFDEQLRRVGATTIIAQFGTLESLTGPGGIDEFKSAYRNLLDEIQKQARQIVLVTPPPFQRPPNDLIPDLSKRNVDLKQYVDATAEVATERNLVFVDLFSDAKTGLTENGMHVAPIAQSQLANEIARQLGIEPPATNELETLRPAVIEKHRLWYDYWRPSNWKLLYGDDAERQFTQGGDNHVRFKEEWKRLLALIDTADQRVWQIAAGGADPGDNRPEPEVLHADPTADIQKEQESFRVMDGFEVNLFASEVEGLTSPLAVRWDTARRMYVTVTTTYPHVIPGDLPNDKIIILEDTNNDGVADKSSIFADGLNIPTGLELGDGGVYIGQNTELLFLKDTDGDGRADVRKVLLGGFGNGDSHQTINSFIWSPGGELYFGQGDGCESRVETPWGSSDLFQAGFYRLRPKRLQMHPLLDDFMGPGNPWGVAFDEWGQIFSVDGAGGVTFLSPGQVPASHRLRLREIGKDGGYCGIGYLDGPQMPESYHGDFVIGDYKRNQVKRFSVSTDGAGFKLTWHEPILKSSHRNFRPVDVKQGPDGAIYVVDWYNPITCHQDDAYRDPTRDKAHGRIWRVSAHTPDGSKAASRRGTHGRRSLNFRDSDGTPDFSDASIGSILQSLKSSYHFTRYQAKRALTDRDPQAVAAELTNWVRSLNPNQPRFEHHLYEALGACATIELVDRGLLNRVLNSQDPRARAYATRVVGRWHDRLEDPLALLADRVTDEHPLVRMEAVIACSAMSLGRSIVIAAKATDHPVDAWIEYAFEQTVRHLEPHWMPALQRGELAFEKPNQLAAVLNIMGGTEASNKLKSLVAEGRLSSESKLHAIGAILAVGSPDDLKKYGLDAETFVVDGAYDASFHAKALARLIEVARFRDERPTGNLAAILTGFIDHPHAQLRASAVTLAGLWEVNETEKHIRFMAEDHTLPVFVRAAAMQAIVQMKSSEGPNLLKKLATESNLIGIRFAAIRSLASVDQTAAAMRALKLFTEIDLHLYHEEATKTLLAFLRHAGGAEALARAVGSNQIEAKHARLIMRSLFATGRSNDILFGSLNRVIGSVQKTPDYAEKFVDRLVIDASSQGDFQRGEVLFRSLACSSCHQVGGAPGGMGPDLSAIGTTLSAHRIVEEMLWPNRQVKEGYAVVQIITDDGQVFQGFERTSKEGHESKDVVLQDLSTKQLITIDKKSIEERHLQGSSMPDGLTAVLERPQLLDLIHYVTGLGKIK